VQTLRGELAAGTRDPMATKKALAFELTARCHDRESAVAAQARFEREVQGRQRPEEIPEVEIPFAAEYEWLPAVLERAALVKSRGEAIRLIQQGAVRVEGERITDKDYQLSGLAPAVVQVGKRRYAKIIPHLSPR